MPGFSKSQRLLTKKDFDTAFNGPGQKIVCRDFVLIATDPKATQPARLGLVVSGKVGNAVIRNRVKRSVRDVFRNELSDSRVLSGRDVVVIARPSLVNPEGHVKEDLRDSLRTCFGRLLKRLSEPKT